MSTEYPGTCLSRNGTTARFISFIVRVIVRGADAFLRMFLLDRTRNGNELKEEFAVQGSTGNVRIVQSLSM